jgi:oligoendopeptidase F
MSLPLPRPVFDTQAGGDSFGDLPEWDLSDLYPGPDAPELTRDMDWLKAECAGFAADYEGRLADLDAAAFLACVQRYERIDTVAGRVMSFVGCAITRTPSTPPAPRPWPMPRTASPATPRRSSSSGWR